MAFRHLLLSTAAVEIILCLVPKIAHADPTEIGSVDVTAVSTRGGQGNGIGFSAAPGSAPALAPSQAPLNSIQPRAVVSDKFIQDVLVPTADFSSIVQYTPGVATRQPNGPLGGGENGLSIRGFGDGQFNITFDGIPFADPSDFSHHTGAYFPGFFLGQVAVDRGPGLASTIGYATFGGTIALNSKLVTDEFGGRVQGSYGSFSSWTTAGEVRTGVTNPTGTRALLDFSHSQTAGALQYGNTDQTSFLAKIEQPLGDSTTVTALATYTDSFNFSATSISPVQTALYGKGFGGLNNNPNTQNFYSYNFAKRETDLEYIGIKSVVNDITIDDKVYSVAFHDYQPQAKNLAGNNPDGSAGIGVKFPLASGGTYNNPNGVPGTLKLYDFRTVGNILSVAKDFNAGIASGTMRAGLWYEHAWEHQWRPNMVWNTGQTFTQLGAVPPTAYAYNVYSQTDNFQPSLEYEWRPVEGLAITPGYKHITYIRHLSGPVNSVSGGPPAYASGTYNADLALVSLNYRFNENSAAYMQIAQGFLAPNLSYLQVSQPQGNNFKPQQTMNYQLGYVYKSDNITADVDVYYIDFSNQVVSVGSGINQYYTNIGGVIRKGIEGQITYAFGNGLAIFGSGSLNDGRMISTGLTSPSTPRYLASAGLIYDNNEGFFGSFISHFNGSMFTGTGQSLTNNYNKVAPWTTTDVAFGWKMFNIPGIHSAKVQFGIANIFDSRQATSNSITLLSNGQLDPYNSTYFYIPSRTAYVSLSMDF
ncbi:TonB-dependent receptor [Beijerinckia indica]|nr:TonB-dependent receptor [Beijerinckia indica]